MPRGQPGQQRGQQPMSAADAVAAADVAVAAMRARRLTEADAQRSAMGPLGKLFKSQPATYALPYARLLNALAALLYDQWQCKTSREWALLAAQVARHVPQDAALEDVRAVALAAVATPEAVGLQEGLVAIDDALAKTRKSLAHAVQHASRSNNASGDSGDNSENVWEVREILSLLLYKQAQVRTKLGHHAAALRVGKEAVELAYKLVTHAPDVPAIRQRCGRILIEHGTRLVQTPGGPEQAIPMMLEALDHFTAVIALGADVRAHQFDVFIAHNDLSKAYKHANQCDQALASINVSIDIARQIEGDLGKNSNPNRPQFLLTTLQQRIHVRGHNNPETKRDLVECLELARKVATINPVYKNNVRTLRAELALEYMYSGELDQAGDLCKEAIVDLDQFINGNDSDTDDSEDAFIVLKAACDLGPVIAKTIGKSAALCVYEQVSNGTRAFTTPKYTRTMPQWGQLFNQSEQLIKELNVKGETDRSTTRANTGDDAKTTDDPVLAVLLSLHKLLRDDDDPSVMGVLWHYLLSTETAAIQNIIWRRATVLCDRLQPPDFALKLQLLLVKRHIYSSSTSNDMLHHWLDQLKQLEESIQLDTATSHDTMYDSQQSMVVIETLVNVGLEFSRVSSYNQTGMASGIPFLERALKVAEHHLGRMQPVCAVLHTMLAEVHMALLQIQPAAVHARTAEIIYRSAFSSADRPDNWVRQLDDLYLFYPVALLAATYLLTSAESGGDASISERAMSYINQTKLNFDQLPVSPAHFYYSLIGASATKTSQSSSSLAASPSTTKTTKTTKTRRKRV